MKKRILLVEDEEHLHEAIRLNLELEDYDVVSVFKGKEAIIKIIPDPKLSVKKGGIAPLGKYQENWIFKQVEVILINAGHNLSTPIKEISEDNHEVVINSQCSIIQDEPIVGNINATEP